MTRGQLLVDLKNMIGPSPEVGDPGLITWLNDAYMYMVDEIVKENPDYFTKASATNTVANQREYALPSDYEKILMVNVQYGGTWRRGLPLVSNINQIPIYMNTNSNQGFNPGDPHYYIFGNKIGFMPITPDNQVNGIEIWYCYTPSELNLDSDIPAIPTKYHHIIKYLAYASYLEEDGQHGAAQSIRNYFEARVVKMTENLGDNQIDEPRSIIITQNHDLYVDDGYI